MSSDNGGAGEALRRLAVNLFHGYGYNFYREENQLRADDQRIRRMVSELLQQARKALSEAESRYRREAFPPPSRAQPFPPAEVQANARQLEGLAAAVSAVDARIGHLPVPEADRMTARWRNEAETLQRVSAKDVELVEAAQTLAGRVAARGPAQMLADAAAIEGDLALIEQRLRERQALLV